MFKNDEIYGDTIEFYDIAAFSHPQLSESVLRKFVKIAKMNAGILLDIGAGTGKIATEVAKMVPDKEVIALEPSKYMRIAFMSRLMEYIEVREQITVLPLPAGKYDYEEEICGILCMGVLGHMKMEERQYLLRKLEDKLTPNVPVLIGLLDQRFISMPKGSQISVAYQGRLRYETYITDIKQIADDQWEWSMDYKVFCKEKLINIVESHMCWTYDSAESVLNELAQAHFRGIRLSDTLLLATKI